MGGGICGGRNLWRRNLWGEESVGGGICGGRNLWGEESVGGGLKTLILAHCGRHE